MQIMIEVPNELYTEYVAIQLSRSNGKDIVSKLLKAIRDGTPIPKEHGRIGDLSKVYIELNEAQIEGTEEYKGLGKAKRIICNAPTIIEAANKEGDK